MNQPKPVKAYGIKNIKTGKLEACADGVLEYVQNCLEDDEICVEVLITEIKKRNPNSGVAGERH